VAVAMLGGAAGARIGSRNALGPARSGEGLLSLDVGHVQFFRCRRRQPSRLAGPAGDEVHPDHGEIERQQAIPHGPFPHEQFLNICKTTWQARSNTAFDVIVALEFRCYVH
jgi:hypothetical protein